MNKLKLIGIATIPKYNMACVWRGADIIIEIEITDEKCAQPVRMGFRMLYSEHLDRAANKGKAADCVCSFLMKRVKAYLTIVEMKYDGVFHDAKLICDVVRMKLPLIITKSSEHRLFSQNMKTGKIIDQK